MIVTVGHSTHPLDEFIALLQGAEVVEVADVRRLPGSNRYPWFNEDSLADSLADSGIGYRRIPLLSGRRTRQRDVPEEVNGLWRNRSFHNYADYALSAEFDAGLKDLTAAAAQHRTAVMCSEAVWWRCHRRIIADHLLARDLAVAHLMPDGRLDEAHVTAGAVIDGGRVEYPVG